MSKSAPSTLQNTSGTKHRLDIQGLRTLAVLVVVAFHAGATFLPGGFVGVDMFFVISGFLITGTIRSEFARTGTLNLARFFVRRLRRLFPAAMVVIVVTLLALFWFGPAEKFKGYAGDAISSMLYYSNIRYAFGTQGYFADAIATPFLHLWSLSVEEQFYITLALLLLATRTLRSHRLARVIFGMTLVSLALSIIGSIWWPDESYYLIFMRGWEFGIGSLISVAALRLRSITYKAALVLRLLGVALLVFSFVGINKDMAFPGYIALAPTLGTVFIIAAGCSEHQDLISKALSLKPIAFIGDLSYSFYLWHWPLLTVPAIIIGTDLTLNQALAAVGAAFILAIFTYYLVEKPLRLTRRDHVRTGHNLAAAATTAVALVAGSIVAINHVTQRFDTVSAGTTLSAPIAQDIGIAPDNTGLPSQDPFDTTPATSATSATSAATGTATATATATASGSTPSTATTAASPSPKPTVKTDTPVGNLVFPPAGTLTPAISDASTALMQADLDGCLIGLTAAAVKVCNYGPASATNSIVLFGDSHAESLYPAYIQIVKQKGWRLSIIAKSSCAPSMITLGDFTGTAAGRATCDTWRNAAAAKINELKPNLIVMAGYEGEAKRTLGLPAQTFNEQWTYGISGMVAKLPKTSKILFINDTPDWPKPPITCIAKHPTNYSECNMSSNQVTSNARIKFEKAVLEGLGVTVMNLNNVLCPNGTCNVIDRNYIVYKDTHHMSPAFVAKLAPYFWLATESALK